MTSRPDLLLRTTSAGLCCPPGDFHIDPTRPVGRAVITHGHGDHARSGHDAVLATPETLAIMRARFGAEHAAHSQALPYGETIRLGEVQVTLHPAGHVLGSAQILLEWQGLRIVVSGDYKRRRDPTCPPFTPIPCDVFVTEATFGLPVFRHPPDKGEIDKLLHSRAVFPDRAHLVGAYPLGKAQRVIMLLREAGYDRPIYCHGGLDSMNALYAAHGVPLGDLRALDRAKAADLAGEIILAPPSALSDRWSRRLGNAVHAFASGWMSIRARARQQAVELPLVISDHADWDELTETIDGLAPAEIWVTHGSEEALVHWARSKGRAARPLALSGYGEEGEAL
jgi:putative mRNA 3-end processing factor